MFKLNKVVFCTVKIFQNGFVHTSSGFVKKDLIVQNGRFVDSYEATCTVEHIDLKSRYVWPGLIDTQINGGFGIDFTSSINVQEDISVFRKKIVEHGVTSIVPTVISSKSENYKRLLQYNWIEQGNADVGATLLGLHLEGPFLSPEKKGCHSASNIVPIPSFKKGEEQKEALDLLKLVYGLDWSQISIVTLDASNDSFLHLLKNLQRHGIIVSIGHTTATTKQISRAIDEGATYLTHLMNANSPITARSTSVAGVVFDHDEKTPKTPRNYRRLLNYFRCDQGVIIEQPMPFFYGLISDGLHVSDINLKLLYKCYPKGCVLVSDAIKAMSSKEKNTTLGDLNINIIDAEIPAAYIVNTTTLAGSVQNLFGCLLYMIKTNKHVPVHEVIECATSHPAELLGLKNVKGTLSSGADADFIIVSQDSETGSYTVDETWIQGNKAWAKTECI